MMDISAVESIVVKAIGVALTLSLPFLGISLIAGVVISLLQSITQVNEQTLTFVPKLIIILVLFVLLLPWALEYMGTYMYELFLTIPEIRP